MCGTTDKVPHPEMKILTTDVMDAIFDMRNPEKVFE